jgi:excisionase family DNA binding protein
MKTLITTDEAAAILRCKPDKIRRLIRSGKLRASDSSTGSERAYYLISQQAINDYLASTEVVASEPVSIQKPQLRRPRFLRA